MKYILSVLLVLLCLCSSSLLYGYVLKYSRKSNKYIPVVAVLSVLIIGIVLRMFDDETAGLIVDVLLPVSFSVVPYALFNSKSKKTFILSGIMICSVFDLLEYAVSSVFHLNELNDILLIYSALYGLTIILTLIIGRLLNTRIIPGFLEQIPSIIYIAIFIVNYSAYYGLSVVVTSESYSQAAVILNCLAACISTCGICFIIHRYFVLIKKQKDDENIFALELNRYEEMIQKNHDMSAFRHDYANNLFALNTLLETQRITEAKEYVDSLTDSISNTKSKFQTGNILADAIISDKAEKAAKDDTFIDFDGSIPADKISNRDLCVIISNSLDNALEACVNIPSARIKIKAESNINGLKIIITNPVLEKTDIHKGKIQTSKADKRLHGFGISNIRNVAKKYNGYVDVFCTETEFIMDIGLVFC